MHVVRALFPYDGENTGVVHVLCPNDGDYMHAICALMSELTAYIIDLILSPPVSMLDSIYSWFDLTLTTFPTK